MSEITPIKHHIAGKEQLGQNPTRIEVVDPALAQVIRYVNPATQKEVEQAISAAKSAFETWRYTPASKRAQLFFKYHSIIEKDIDNFARIIGEEHGKSIADAKGSIGRGIEVLEYCTGITSHLKSDFSYNVAQDIDCYNIRQPLGVVAGITPFNFPEMVPMWMYPIAIACGNAFILKPSEKNPSAANYQAEKMLEAGFPAGLLSVLHGDKSVVDALLNHQDIKAISFVGSTPVGEYIYKQGSKNLKRVQALCGAKNHLVLMPDANLELATDAILGSAYGASGQRCMAVSVVVAVGDQLADGLVEKLKPKVENLKIGHYSMDGVEFGPISTEANYNRVLGLIEKGQAQGAELVVDGRGQKVENYEAGYFIGGVLFDKVTPEMDIYKEEIFGPVLSIVRVADYSQAIDLINKNPYGNGVALFTNQADIARHFSVNIEVGMVGVNVPIPVPVAYHSFGGWKNSLYGANSIYGPEGVRFYTKLKTITNRLKLNPNSSQFHFKRGSDS